jgi:hypothetical protein
MSETTDVLIDLIKDMIGVLKSKTQLLQLDALEKELAEQEDKLNKLKEENIEDMMMDEMEGGCEDDEGFELSIHDLSKDYQEFIANTMGYETIEELLTEHPDLNNVILTRFKL